MSSLSARCFGTAAGVLIDRATPEPSNALHPVAWFGTAMTRVEETFWADRRGNGAAYTAVGIGLGVLAGKLVRSTTAVVAIATAGRQLRSTADHIGNITAMGELDQARAALPALVGRDPRVLDESGIAAAVIESVAENSVDAVIAPIFWAAVAGAPGAAAYRAINTMDAMVGHRSIRFRNFGWAAARVDDAANYVPARLFAGLVAAQSPTRGADILAVVRRDASAHPSPNAGVAETAMAAALGCELGGTLRYGPDVEHRPTLGTGPRPTASDISAAIIIANRAEISAVVLLVLGSLIGRIRRAP